MCLLVFLGFLLGAICAGLLVWLQNRPTAGIVVAELDPRKHELVQEVIRYAADGDDGLAAARQRALRG